jgi:hypothetical protein
MDYFVLRAGMRDGYAVVHALEGAGVDSAEITSGKPALARFGDGAFFQIPPELKKSEKLGDAIPAYTHLVVSQRCKDAIAGLAGGSKVEHLPVRIKSAAGKLLEGQFFIVHPLDVRDVVDMDASGAELNDLTPSTIFSVERLVLKAVDAEIFRLARWSEVIVVRADVAAALKAGEFFGLKLTPAAKFTG